MTMTLTVSTMTMVLCICYVLYVCDMNVRRVCVSVDSWEGNGVNEVGKDKATGVVRVKINPKYYRPTEVVRLPVTSTCTSVTITLTLLSSVLLLLLLLLTKY